MFILHPNHFCLEQVMVYGITIWFARRWGCNTPGEIDPFYDCQWINVYKCMLTHYSMVTPYQLNYIPICSWFVLLHFISISAFPPESRTRKEANLHLVGINRLITINSWVQLAFWSLVSIIYIYIYIYVYYNFIAGKTNLQQSGFISRNHSFQVGC